MIWRSDRLQDAKNYATMAKVVLDVGEWIRKKYIEEKGQ
jgi:hypothetical protein